MSHTVIMLIAGVLLLVVLRLAIRDVRRATRLFILLWLLVSIGNLDPRLRRARGGCGGRGAFHP